jgi:hypothetical protein
MEKSTQPKVSLTISSPENYPSFTLDENGKRKERVAYQVTGSKEAIEQYNADMLARTGKVSLDKVTGNPLFTGSIESFGKTGVSATIERSSKPNDKGHYGWFVNTDEAKLIDKAMESASPAVQSAHATAEYNKIVLAIKQMSANKRAKSSVVAEEKADLGK